MRSLILGVLEISVIPDAGKRNVYLMRTTIRILTSGILAVTAAGVVSNLLVMPALAQRDGGHLALASLWPTLSMVFWTTAWIAAVALLWLAARALVELVGRRVDRRAGRGVFAAAIAAGAVSLASMSFVVPHAAASIAFTRVDENPVSSPIAPMLAVIALLATVALSIIGLGFAAARRQPKVTP